MRIAVTGGAGFIGHHLVRTLIGHGHDITVLDNLRRSSFERPDLCGATCYEGDVRSPSDCRAAFNGAEVVVHLAAQSNVMGSQSDPQYTYETNVTGTWNVAHAAAAAGVRHLVFASSREVYGEAVEIPVAESAALRPHNLYGATKVAGEVLLAALPSGSVPVSVVRLSNVIGSGDSGRVVPLWLDNAREGRPLTVFGGNQLMDLVPVDFACRAIVRIIEQGPLPGSVNVGSGTATRILDLARHIVRLTGSSSPVEVVPPRGPEVTRFCADTTRLRELVGVEPPANPLDSIEATW